LKDRPNQRIQNSDIVIALVGASKAQKRTAKIDSASTDSRALKYNARYFCQALKISAK